MKVYGQSVIGLRINCYQFLRLRKGVRRNISLLSGVDHVSIKANIVPSFESLQRFSQVLMFLITDAKLKFE